jgi:hypothetical protein
MNHTFVRATSYPDNNRILIRTDLITYIVQNTAYWTISTNTREWNITYDSGLIIYNTIESY